jgi:hypothetical protein
MLNGNISFVDPKRTVDAFKKSFAAFSKGKESQEAFDLYLDYTRRGITGTNPMIGEMVDLGARIQKQILLMRIKLLIILLMLSQMDLVNYEEKLQTLIWPKMIFGKSITTILNKETIMVSSITLLQEALNSKN